MAVRLTAFEVRRISINQGLINAIMDEIVAAAGEGLFTLDIEQDPGENIIVGNYLIARGFNVATEKDDIRISWENPNQTSLD